MSALETMERTKAMKDPSPWTPPASELGESYRVVSRSAIASLVVFVLGLAGLVVSVLLILPVAGALLAFSAWRTIRRYPEEFTGEKMALYGMGLNALLFVGGSTLHTVEYVTEVPEGFERITFGDLQPETMRQANMLPEKAKQLHGKPVFVKGYVHPGVDGMGRVKEFVLVPDMGTCCFGGQPKLTDMILVHTDDQNRVAYRRRMVKLAGKFGIGRELESSHGVSGVLYRLEASYSR